VQCFGRWGVVGGVVFRFSLVPTFSQSTTIRDAAFYRLRVPLRRLLAHGQLPRMNSESPGLGFFSHTCRCGKYSRQHSSSYEQSLPFFIHFAPSGETEVGESGSTLYCSPLVAVVVEVVDATATGCCWLHNVLGWRTRY
jgi:hypothetical protein